MKWSQATAEQKLEYLLDEIKRMKQLAPLLNPIEETPADRLFQEKQTMQMTKRLTEAHDRIKELERWREETNREIARIMAWVNSALRERGKG